MPSQKDKVVVLSSGGLNSAVAACIAAADFTPAFLHIRFGHRAAERECELFRKQVEHFGIAEHLIIDMPHFEDIGGNGRVNPMLQIEDVQTLGDGTSSSYIPGMVASMLSAGFTWASTIEANRVFLGVSEDLGPPAPRTGAVFPDYSREHIELVRQAFQIASTEKRVTVETPLIDLSRTEIVKLGNRLNTPFELTWSCISCETEACGNCLGCATRNRAFLDAAIPDPVVCGTAVS